MVIGPLTGSFLAGMVALFVMMRNQKYDSIKEKIKAKENFTKASIIFEHSIINIIRALEVIDATQRNNIVFFQKKDFFTVSYEIIKKSLNELEHIPNDYFNSIGFKYYIEARSTISSFESDFGKFLINFTEDNPTTFFYTINLKSMINELEQLQKEMKNISM